MYYHFLSKKALRNFIQSASSFKRRSIFSDVIDYLNDRIGQRKIAVLYGLQETGKTSLIKQLISALPNDLADLCVYFEATASTEMWRLETDLAELVSQGFRYFFLDEITHAQGFLNEAQHLATYFVESGIKIVLAGTHSLDFWFLQRYQAYDRCQIFPMTFISYAEWSYLFSNKETDFLNYLRCAGSLSFLNQDDTLYGYIDSAVGKNIQHALLRFEQGKELYELEPLEEKGELVEAVSSVIEKKTWSDMYSLFSNIAFLAQDNKIAGIIYKITDKDTVRLTSYKANISFVSYYGEKYADSLLIKLGQDKNRNKFVKSLCKDILKSLDIELGRYSITEEQVDTIYSYLSVLHFALPMEQVFLWAGDYSSMELSENEYKFRKKIERRAARTLLFIQPRLRLAILISTLREIERRLQQIDPKDTAYFKEIEHSIFGVVCEETILVETMVACTGLKNLKSNNRYRVCKVFFLDDTKLNPEFEGEIDMLVQDRDEKVCALYEIKLAKETKGKTFLRHISDEQKLEAIRTQFGTIVKRAVLFSGPMQTTPEGILFQNIEQYLKTLHRDTWNTIFSSCVS